MTRIANVSLGAARAEIAERSVSLGEQRFTVTRYGVDRDLARARSLLAELDGQVDVIALSGVFPSVAVAGESYTHPEVDALLALPQATPVVTGHDLRTIYQRWCLRHLVRTEPDLFGGRAAAFYMGILDLELVPVVDEAARALRLGDPFLHLRVPAVLESAQQLAAYARVVAPLLVRRAMSSLASGGAWYRRLRERWAERMAEADVFVAPWAQLQSFGGAELSGKIVVTDRAAPHVLQFLAERGVVHTIATYPSAALAHHLDWSVLEAMLWSLGSPATRTDAESALRGLSSLAASPEVQRFGALPQRRRRFAFVVQPRDQRDLLRHPALKPVARMPKRVRNAVEMLVGLTRPRAYGAMTGAHGVDGARADGLVIALPSTPSSASSTSTRQARRQLRSALKRAERWGAEIVALGPTARAMVEASGSIGKSVRVPVTTGNALQASTAFAAARAAVLRLGFVPLASSSGALLALRCLILGASGSFGSVAAHLCADEYSDVILAGPRPDRLLELKTAIDEGGARDKRAHIVCTTEPESEIARADLIIVATGVHGPGTMELARVKPGCVVCDVGRPASITSQAAQARPDVLVIDGGVVEIPGAELDCDLGLPGTAIYATLAEATVLALEGRFESYSGGAPISLERVREIAAIGKRQGVRLAALRGPGGVVTDEDVALCREAALRALRRATPSA
ncbi:MAG TPA: hypothetical protein VGO62_18315 [Myxococcota bacterium]